MGNTVQGTIGNKHNKMIWVKYNVEKKYVRKKDYGLAGQAGCFNGSVGSVYSVTERYDWKKIKTKFTPVNRMDFKRLAFNSKDSIRYWTIVAADGEIICNKWPSSDRHLIVIYRPEGPALRKADENDPLSVHPGDAKVKLESSGSENDNQEPPSTTKENTANINQRQQTTAHRYLLPFGPANMSDLIPTLPRWIPGNAITEKELPISKVKNKPSVSIEVRQYSDGERAEGVGKKEAEDEESNEVHQEWLKREVMRSNFGEKKTDDSKTRDYANGPDESEPDDVENTYVQSTEGVREKEAEDEMTVKVHPRWYNLMRFLFGKGKTNDKTLRDANGRDESEPDDVENTYGQSTEGLRKKEEEHEMTKTDDKKLGDYANGPDELEPDDVENTNGQSTEGVRKKEEEDEMTINAHPHYIYLMRSLFGEGMTDDKKLGDYANVPDESEPDDVENTYGQRTYPNRDLEFDKLSADEKLSTIYSILTCIQDKSIQLEHKINSFIKTNQRVDSMETVMNSFDDRLKLLEYTSVNNEARARRKKLSFNGITETRDENFKRIICNFSEEKLGSDKLPGVERAHRLGARRDPGGGPRPIIVAFSFYRDTENIMTSANALKDSPFGTSRDYPIEFNSAWQTLRLQTSIDYPAKLIVNGHATSDMFSDWTHIMEGSKPDYSVKESATVSSRTFSLQSVPQKVREASNPNLSGNMCTPYEANAIGDAGDSSSECMDAQNIQHDQHKHNNTDTDTTNSNATGACLLTECPDRDSESDNRTYKWQITERQKSSTRADVTSETSEIMPASDTAQSLPGRKLPDNKDIDLKSKPEPAEISIVADKCNHE